MNQSSGVRMAPIAAEAAPGGVRSAPAVPVQRLTSRAVETISSMDPRLQRARARMASGARRIASASTATDEIAVIAKVSDLAAWEQLTDVRTGEVLGGVDREGGAIVTARIPIKRIDAVRQQPFVTSLKAAQRVHKQLAATTQETLSRPKDLQFPATGKDVVVGVVDFGGDFAHRNFRKAGGSTRLLALWDQGSPVTLDGAGYGAVYRTRQINAALKKTSPYAALGYLPEPASHGTHVMDIAAGNGRGTKVPGMAPQADLVFVELSASDVAWSGPESARASFGDSVQLLEAVSFVFREAGTRPCVVNLSLGTNGGPHDGSSLVEQGIDRLVRAAPNRAVVIAASNSQDDGIHACGTVQGSCDLSFRTQPGPGTEDELEVWYPGAGRLRAELVAPDGTSVCVVQPGETVAVDDQAGSAVVGMVSSRLDDPNNHDNVVNVWLGTGMPKGGWTLRLSSDQPTPFHAWIERNDDAQASFTSMRADTHCLGSLSCGHESIVVGSYDAHKASCPISWFSSAGPTRDNRQKPEVSAPGHAVVAARSRSGSGTTNMSGTSMAAPAVAGMVALLLSEAKRRKLSLTSAQIRSAIVGTARPAPAGAWDARYGQGRVCGRDALASLAVLQPIAVKKAPATRAAVPPVRVAARSRERPHLRPPAR